MCRAYALPARISSPAVCRHRPRVPSHLKPEREGEESALLLEARAAVRQSARSLCPAREEDDVRAGLARADGAEAEEQEFEEEGEEEGAV